MMTVAQEKHLKRLKERFVALLDAKYRAGQTEHGGNLWRKRMVPNIVEETLDLAAYTLTLEQQVEDIKDVCVAGESGEMTARDALKKIRRLL